MTAWIVCNLTGQYRRTKIGNAEPPLRKDEYAYRVVLPSLPVTPRRIVHLGKVGA